MTIPRSTLLVFLILPAIAHGQTVDYLREVKPILAASCYTCHGAIKQKGGLRLDTVASMKEGGDHGSAVKDSLILKHILGEKGFRRMPPLDEGEPLKPAQVALIKRWIEQGSAGPKDEKPEADPRDHWAFRPPVRPKIPQPAAHAARLANPIDAFLAVEHEKHGLTPQGPAEHGIWLRRVHLDLIGLPPTREEQAAFLKELEGAKPPAIDAAYEKVVDRLLASPQYGERWGRHWMDIWRYSDWWGLGAELRNSQRHIWHWRDWIVESLNKDKGYDQMLREMIAADELYPTNADALRGTGFLARHYFLFNRTTWLDETIEHTSKAFLGLTFNCCKCHDHKYDAFSQADYYRFRAIFEPYQIRNDLVPGETNVEKNGLPRVYDANLDVPTYLHSRGNEQNIDKSRVMKPGLPSLLLPGGLQVKPIKLPAEAHSPGLRALVVDNYLRGAEHQLELGRKELAAARSRLAISEKTKTTPVPQINPKELIRDNFASLNKDRWESLGGEWKLVNGKLVQEKTGTVRGVLRLREAPPTNFEVRAKFATLDGDIYKSVGISFDVDKDHEALVYLTPHPPARIQVSFKKDGKHVYPMDGAQQHAVPLNKIHEVVLRVRGNLLNVSVNGKTPLVYRLPIARSPGKIELITYDASARFEEFVLSTLPADVEMADGGKVDGPINEKQARALVRVAEAKIAHAEASITAVKARSAADRAIAEGAAPDAIKKLKIGAALAEKTQALELAQWNLARVEAGHIEVKLNPAQAKAAVEAAKKALQNPGDAYTPLVGSVKTRENNLETDANRLKPFPKESTGRRAALAQWVADRDNPLTARVAVNHIWARHFGQPLVATVFDFGRKGAAPTHPALLDWLAVELMEPGKPAGERSEPAGWRMKHLHRLIVTSNAYRMTSSSLGAGEKNLKDDPENRYLWRMNSTRMESQVVRDSLLHLAGELDLTLGGFPVETPKQEASKRRSLYFFHSAIERNRFLMTFDEADPLDCYRRRDSIIPQQALALSNSALAGRMAEKIATQVPAKDFSREAFTWMLGYAPTANELAACEEAMTRWVELNKMRPDAQQRARAQLIGALLNHNDFITIR